MAAGILEGREALTNELQRQLAILAGYLSLAGQNNLSSSHVAAETTAKGLLNRVYGWELVNANTISQNFPGVDLIDTDNNIAVQVTANQTVKKVKDTLEKVGKRGVVYDKLIVLFLTNEKPTQGMRECRVPAYSGPVEVWNLGDVLRDAKELDPVSLSALTEYMESELGTIKDRVKELPHLELPPAGGVPPTGFVGRESELAEIRSRFHRGDKEVVLTGLGGMGKTELAVQYGRAQSTAYFVRFDTDFTRTLASMASGIRPRLTDEELQQDDGSLCKRVLELLEQSGKSDLLIIDNADSPTGALADLLKDPVYKAIRALPLRRLLTTRSHAPRAIEVTPMEAEPLFKIFKNHGAELTKPEMEALIDAVNGHTLTVDLIARTLNGRGWRRVTAEDMLTALREHTLREQKYRKIATDYSQSPEQAQIYEHLSVVFDMSGMSDAGKQVMRCASLLHDIGMDAELFGTSLEEAAQEALDTLLGQGWLEVRKGLMTIHPIIRLVCREELKPTEETCWPFLKNVWDWYDEKKYDKDRFRQIAELFTAASDVLGDPDGWYIAQAGYCWGQLGESQLALKCNLRAVELMEQSQPDSNNLAAAYNNVGAIYDDLGDHQKALEYKLKALAIREKILPPEHLDLATSYNNEGNSYYALGDHKKALEYLLKALAIWEKVLPQDHPSLATSYNNVGMTYCALGDHQKALKYNLKALAIREKSLSPKHPDLATSYNNVGNTYYALGDHQKALEYLLKALAIYEKVLPPEHPYNAMCCNNIAWTYYEMGQHEQALELMRRAADIAERSLPEGHSSRVNYRKWAQQLEHLTQC